MGYTADFIEGLPAAMRKEHTSPVVVPPGGSLVIYTWGASMSNSPEVEFEMGYWER